MEQYIILPTADGHEINGVLNWKEKSEKLIIFCHGFQGNSNSYLIRAGSKYFCDTGYSTFRINFYGPGEKNRKLHECDFQTHGNDIDTSINFFKEGYKEIYLIGHSFGGLSILYSKKNIHKNILWDPSLSMNGESIADLEDMGKYYLSKGSFDVYVSKKMFDQYVNESKQKYHDTNKNYSIICAEKSSLPSLFLQIKNDLLSLKSYETISGASHSFDEEGKEIELFEKTLEFIEK